MRRVTFLNRRGHRLVADLDEVSDRMVVLVHGFTSDRRSRGRHGLIREALRAAGFSSFAFDFAGCGESDDTPVTIAGEVEDLCDAVHYLRACGYPDQALWGNSLGARVCLEANPPGSVTMVLTGAGAGPATYDWTQEFSVEQLAHMAETGRLVIPLAEGPRRDLVVAAQTLEEFATMDQARVLQAVERPVLIIHGDGDAEERMLHAISQRALQHLPGGSRIELIPGAGHGFAGHEGRLVELGLAWLTRAYPSRS